VLAGFLSFSVGTRLAVVTSMKTYNVTILSPVELAKADADPNYAPLETIICTVTGTGQFPSGSDRDRREALRIASALCAPQRVSIQG
jgi:hypothetical protein